VKPIWFDGDGLCVCRILSLCERYEKVCKSAPIRYDVLRNGEKRKLPGKERIAPGHRLGEALSVGEQLHDNSRPKNRILVEPKWLNMLNPMLTNPEN
jgi:hypothetical protein